MIEVPLESWKADAVGLRVATWIDDTPMHLVAIEVTRTNDGVLQGVSPDAEQALRAVEALAFHADKPLATTRLGTRLYVLSAFPQC